MGMVSTKTLTQRFWEKVDKSDPAGCWRWLGSHTADGYGNIGTELLAKGKMKVERAHRLMWTWVNGDPGNLTIDHLCRVRDCVNPCHLEAVSHKTNVRRGNGHAGINAKKTHCIRDHEFTLENTIVFGNNWRRCRPCTEARV